MTSVIREIRKKENAINDNSAPTITSETAIINIAIRLTPFYDFDAACSPFCALRGQNRLSPF